MSYRYDVFNNRIAKTVDSDGAGPAEPVTERFIYDDNQIAFRLDAAGAITHRYLFGPGADQVLVNSPGLLRFSEKLALAFPKRELPLGAPASAVATNAAGRNSRPRSATFHLA